MTSRRRHHSVLARITAMLTSLITFPKRQPEAVPAVEAVPVPRTTTDNESAILEILQVVHDLRNQLTIMSLAADIPETSPIERERRLLDLHRAVERSVVLINALLMNERSSAADRTVDDANEVVRRTTATLSHASSQGVRVQLHLWAEPLPVSADVGDLDRVLLNRSE